MKRLLAVFTLIVFFFMSIPAFGQNPVSLGAIKYYDPQISPMEKGDKAPFAGTLFNVDAAAKVLTDIANADKQCQIETDKIVAIEKAKLQLELDNLRAFSDAMEGVLKARITLKNTHIEWLENRSIHLAKKERRTVFWLLGGIASGIALSIGGAFILKQIRSDPEVVIVQ